MIFTYAGDWWSCQKALTVDCKHSREDEKYRITNMIRSNTWRIPSLINDDIYVINMQRHGGTFGSDFAYGYLDGLQFGRLKKREPHDCLVDIMRSFRAKSYGSEMFIND
ncbi:hypothetical protein E3N88_12603 [Mikania micrantha]|uniref:Uncharacterized protein n=1 Tax=Mikania micrantha TaxID=192012 RepID=A0A5N6MMR6_9ASTR|nr:hypothetical protein E3N88_30764 [Mikania micrantha]KAD5961130.1 hypothetical protein E3N88_12603 [Mikania micrantha]